MKDRGDLKNLILILQDALDDLDAFSAYHENILNEELGKFRDLLDELKSKFHEQ